LIRVLVIDFETAWDRKLYSLKSMTTEEYIRDKRFKAWGCACKEVGSNEPAEWVGHDRLASYFAGIDWGTTAVMAHNAQFDVSILSWRYGHMPCAIFDTLSMARALYGTEGGLSLDKLAARFGLPTKNAALHSTDGLLDTLSPEVEMELAAYCVQDVYVCEEIYKRLNEGNSFPIKELRLIDLTLRMYVNAVLVLDKEMLVDAIETERSAREDLLERLKVTEADLASNDRFAEVLRSIGVPPPTKISPRTNKEAFAFAKTDALFQALVEGDNEAASLLCEARMMVKSTQSRTRAQRFLSIASRGTLPVPLTYYGAHTGRWTASKGSGLNMQNLKRGSFLRRAVCAPEGYTLVVADLAQIEPRVLAYLSDFRELLRVFSARGDPYASFGAIMFNIPGMTKESHPDLRQSAKSALLGCGYGMGWANFAGQLLTGFLGAPPVLYGISFAKQLGISPRQVEFFGRDEETTERMRVIPRTCTNEELLVHCVICSHIIDTYRVSAQPVQRFWRVCDDYIAKCLVEDSDAAKFGGRRSISHKGVTFAPGRITLPNGMALRYPDLHGSPDEKGRVQWTYDTGKGRTKLYGGKLTENIVQAVARLPMTDGMLRVQKRYPCVLTVHDEAVFLVPKTEEEEAMKWVEQQMTKEAPYLPGVPLEVSMGSSKRYGDAK